MTRPIPFPEPRRARFLDPAMAALDAWADRRPGRRVRRADAIAEAERLGIPERSMDLQLWLEARA